MPAKHPMNVLLTSVGRRAYLVDYFREALRGRGRVFAANTTLEAHGMRAADQAFLVPSANDPAFVSSVFRICVDHHVNLVCSLHDWEAPFLSAAVAQFRAAGIMLAVSSPEVITLCLDKYKTFEFAMTNGVATPMTMKSLTECRAALGARIVQYPLVIKPRIGQGSVGVDFVDEDWELDTCHRRTLRMCRRMASNGLLAEEGDESVIIQQRIKGDEYVLDIVNDFTGRFVCCLAKRKISMRAGETDFAETVYLESLQTFGEKLGHIVGHVGIMGVDVIMEHETPYLIEMNPRFTGHYPFAHIAGANIPAALIAWASGENAQPEWLRVQPNIKSFKGICVHLATDPAA